MNVPPKCLRVTVEWEGRTETLEGVEAEKWVVATTEQATFCFAHGMKFPELGWISTSVSPKEDT